MDGKGDQDIRPPRNSGEWGNEILQPVGNTGQHGDPKRERSDCRWFHAGQIPAAGGEQATDRPAERAGENEAPAQMNESGRCDRECSGKDAHSGAGCQMERADGETKHGQDRKRDQ